MLKKHAFTHNLIVYQWNFENKDLLEKYKIDYKKIDVADDDEGNVGVHWEDAFEWIEILLYNNPENRNIHFTPLNKSLEGINGN